MFCPIRHKKRWKLWLYCLILWYAVYDTVLIIVDSVVFVQATLVPCTGLCTYLQRKL
jgi:hypothetical protein